MVKKKKMGRPSLGTSFQLTVHLTKDQQKFIEKLRRKTGGSRGDIVRSALTQAMNLAAF